MKIPSTAAALTEGGITGSLWRGFTISSAFLWACRDSKNTKTRLLQSDNVSLCLPWRVGFSRSAGNWSRENQLCCGVQAWKAREEEGWWYFPACSLILKHRCCLRACWLCLWAYTLPPSLLLQSVCPSDPPLNPDYYGFVLLQTCDLQRWGAAKGYLVMV